MPALVDLTGETFGNLVVLYKHHTTSKSGNIHWVCKCNCKDQKIVIVPSNNLKSGNTQSCGCFQRTQVSKALTKHGARYTQEYKAWMNIKERCYNEKKEEYRYYGGRGIVMSDEWKDDFEAFYRDMGSRPSPEHSVDRKDNDKGYSKENCRWATRIEQANNRRSNIFYTINGETKTLPNWCRIHGINYAKAYHRINFLGWTIHEALKPIEFTSVTFDGETNTLELWCDLFNLNLNNTCLRILRGESFDNIVNES